MFALASAAAAFAGGVGQLVTARAVMGAAAAFIMPATLSILTNTFTDARERAMAIGIWSGVIGIGVVLGPLAGGLPPRPLLVGIGVRRQRADRRRSPSSPPASLVPESRDPDAPRVDWIGGALSVARARRRW